MKAAGVPKILQSIVSCSTVPHGVQLVSEVCAQLIYHRVSKSKLDIHTVPHFTTQVGNDRKASTSTVIGYELLVRTSIALYAYSRLQLFLDWYMTLNLNSSRTIMP